MTDIIYISEDFFTIEETETFHKNFGYQIREISYKSNNGEIDFKDKTEKEFLLKYGTPKILSRFGN